MQTNAARLLLADAIVNAVPILPGVGEGTDGGEVLELPSKQERDNLRERAWPAQTRQLVGDAQQLLVLGAGL